MERDVKFHWCRYIVSTYIWIVVLGCCFLIPVLYPYSQTINSFEPKFYSTNWHLDEDPITFIQLSDIHVNHVIERNNQRFRQARHWSQEIKPTWTVITGDLCDDFPYKHIPKYGFQQEKDWEIYNKEVQNYTRDVNFIDIAGNHDEFSVYSFDSKQHNFMHGRNLTLDEFYVAKLTQECNIGRKIHMFKLSPYKWPSAHPCFVFWPREDRKFLDLVERQLEDVDDNDTVIFFSHYPLNLWENDRSSKGHTMKDLVSQANGQRFFIAGHLHPKSTVFQHHGNGFEVVAQSLMATNNFGVFTLDHDRFVYTTVDNDKPERFFVTSPVPDSQLTPNAPFYETEGYIRVRSFTDSEPTILVSGAVNGTMSCRHANGADSFGFVCSLKYVLNAGKHTIRITSELSNIIMSEQNVSFRVGVASDKINERQYEDSHWKFYIAIMSILMIVIVAVLVPFHLPKFAEQHDNFMIGKNDKVSWAVTIFGSFFIFKYRISKSPKWLRILIFVAVIYPICLPSTFIEIEGHPGMIFTPGFVCGGKYLYALWGQIHTLMFLGVVILPVLVAVQSAIYSKPFRFVFVFDILLCLSLCAAEIYIIIRNISESASLKLALLSPCFVFWPLALWISVAVFRFNTKQHTRYSAFSSMTPFIDAV